MAVPAPLIHLPHQMDGCPGGCLVQCLERPGSRRRREKVGGHLIVRGVVSFEPGEGAYVTFGWKKINKRLLYLNNHI